MPLFRFKALNQSGDPVEGQQMADSEEVAYERLRSRGLHPVSITPARAERAVAKRGKVSRKALSRTMRQLATLLTAGVPLLESLDNLRRGDSDGQLSQRFKALSQHLRQGGRFSQGFKEHFPELPDYVFSLAALGESTGQLPKTLSDAADRMASDDALASELRAALTYPIILASVGGAIVLGMFIFVIPRFGALVDRSGAELPAMSAIVIGGGMWMQKNWPIAIGVSAALVALLRMLAASHGRALRRLAEQLPISGALFRRVDLESWTRTLGIALANGSQLLAALDLASGAVQSRAFAGQLQGVRRDVRAGSQLDEAFEANVSGADPMLLDLMMTGRKSGTLDKMLIFAADTYRSDISSLSKRLTAIAEPAAILLISGVVGTLVVAIVLAMTSLYNFDI